MLEFSEVVLNSVVVHNIGNKNEDEGVRFSKSELQIDTDLVSDLLMKYFLNPFKNEVFYNFFHDTDLNLNEAYTFVASIFNDRDTLVEQSINIARHLYECSNHPKIKGGELYIVYFENCVVDGEISDGIGIFKSENKDKYMKIYLKNDNIEIGFEDGININRLDKGCLIFNTEKESGYKICLVDNLNKGNEAQYWKDDFMKIKQRPDDFYKTNNYLDVCGAFSKKVLGEGNDADKKEQIGFIKKSESYFKENETFNEEDFIEKVISKPQQIEAFKTFKEEYVEQKEIEIEDHFEISKQAMKESKNIFKSVLKLDKNFSIYIHGKPDLMDKGYDQARGMNFYKLFYMEEK